MPPEFRSPVEFLAEVVAFIRRRLSIILLTCLVTLGVALLYLIAAVPTFTAKAELVVDSKAAPGDAASVSTIVESQIAIIKSEGIARAVIEKLGLAEDPEFADRRHRARHDSHPGCSAGVNRKRNSSADALCPGIVRTQAFGQARRPYVHCRDYLRLQRS